MIILFAHLHIQEGKLDAAVETCKSMLAPSRAESGCISYTFFVDHETPNHIMWVEEWESEDILLNGHFKTPHFEAFGAAMGELTTKPADIFIHEVSASKQL